MRLRDDYGRVIRIKTEAPNGTRFHSGDRVVVVRFIPEIATALLEDDCPNRIWVTKLGRPDTHCMQFWLTIDGEGRAWDVLNTYYDPPELKDMA